MDAILLYHASMNCCDYMQPVISCQTSLEAARPLGFRGRNPGAKANIDWSAYAHLSFMKNPNKISDFNFFYTGWEGFEPTAVGLRGSINPFKTRFIDSFFFIEIFFNLL